MTDIDRLAEVIQRAVRPVPLEHALWNAHEVANYLRCENPRQVTERYASREDFPLPVRLPTPQGTRGHPRWYAAEVIKWARKWQERN